MRKKGTASRFRALLYRVRGVRDEIGRRGVMGSLAVFIGGWAAARAGTIAGQLPWRPGAGAPPERVYPGNWLFFNDAEVAAVEAIADRIIPPDPQTPGGKDAGCAVFIDRQLAGPYGRQEGLYVRRRSSRARSSRARNPRRARPSYIATALAALDRHCRSEHGGKAFVDLADADKDDDPARTRERRP